MTRRQRRRRRVRANRRRRVERGIFGQMDQITGWRWLDHKELFHVDFKWWGQE